jgi:ATP-dependent Clp protease ATP-binding subunit ClpA
MTLDLDRKAVAFLVKQGSDEAMGARPLRRAVQRYVEDTLAELLLGESLKPGRIKGTLAKDGSRLLFRQ